MKHPDEMENPDYHWNKLMKMVDEGRADFYVGETGWGVQAQVEIHEGHDIAVSKAELRMKDVLIEFANDALVRMDDAPEDEWDDILEDEDFDEDKRDDLKKAFRESSAP